MYPTAEEWTRWCDMGMGPPPKEPRGPRAFLTSQKTSPWSKMSVRVAWKLTALPAFPVLSTAPVHQHNAREAREDQEHGSVNEDAPTCFHWALLCQDNTERKYAPRSDECACISASWGWERSNRKLLGCEQPALAFHQGYLGNRNTRDGTSGWAAGKLFCV